MKAIKSGFKAGGAWLGADEYDSHVSGYAYILITRPSCKITTGDIGDYIGVSACSDANFVIGNLNYANAVDGAPNIYIPLLTNLAKSFPAFDNSLLVAETAFETYSGFRMPYGQTNKDGRISGQLSITYNETADLLVSSLHNVWLNYIDACKLGYIQREIADMAILDYAASVYFLVTKPDGRTLSYWSKFTGVFPTSVPWSSVASFTKGDFSMPDVSINYTFAYREEMTIPILQDIQQLGTNSTDFLQIAFKSLKHPIAG